MSGARKRANRSSPRVGGESTKTNRNKKVDKKPHKKGSNCLSICFYAFLFIVVLLGAVAAFGYYRAPLTALPVTDFPKEIKLVGKFGLNDKLSKGVKVHGLPGPESFEEDKHGNLYTGLENGKIVRIEQSGDGVVGMGEVFVLTDGKLPNVAKLNGAKHGRPLGIRLLQETLYVADAFAGIYSVNVKNKQVTSLVATDDVNPRLGLTDDLCISKDKKFLYFTDGSSKYTLATMMSYLLEGLCDGRVLQYNMETKKIRTVMSDLCFANGIQLSGDGKLLFVNEAFRFRIRIIDMMTWKTKQFIDVPMVPDNIRPTGKGTYWVAGGSLWTPMLETLQNYAFLRQIISGLFSEEFFAKGLSFDHNIVVEINEDGEVLQTLHDPGANLTKGLTQVTTLKDGRLVLGSYFANWLAFTEGKIDAIGNN